MDKDAIQERYKIVFNLGRISLDTANKILHIRPDQKLEDQILALYGILTDCMWDTQTNQYIVDETIIKKYIESIRLKDLTKLVETITNQIKICNDFTSAINSNNQ